jgi:acetyl-CoA/propionyl-CoA carboxylase, biotin carboxylase, biotin carboxyl carrier protein
VTAQPGGAPVQLRIWGTPDAATVLIGPGAGSATSRTAPDYPAASPGRAPDGSAAIPSHQVSGRFGEAGELLVTSDGLTAKWLHAFDGDSLWLSNGEQTWRLTEVASPSARQAKAQAGAVEVRSPMPGTVLVVDVAPGEEVTLGQHLLVVEAMKMEYAVRAAADGVVQDVLVKAGEQVAMGQLLVTWCC